MTVVDAFGDTGLILDYALIIAFTGSALLLFIYLWNKKRLDFDEVPKHQMLDEDIVD